MMMPNSLYLLEPATSEMESIIFFNDYIMIFITFLSLLTLLMLIFYMQSDKTFKYFVENQVMEVMWTVLPILSLMVMGVYSVTLLLDNESDVSGCDLTVKTTGHQWYWSYDYGGELEFDSYLVKLEDSNSDLFRQLETDHNVVIPSDSFIRLVLTSSDVLHSWTIPSFGVKCDAVPGRLNSLVFSPNKMGLFFGQCSELCGVNHAFMPISVEVIPTSSFMGWIDSFSSNLE